MINAVEECLERDTKSLKEAVRVDNEVACPGASAGLQAGVLFSALSVALVWDCYSAVAGGSRNQ
jgi:hypothetical protein